LPPATARIYYPFHPLAGLAFEVVQRSGGKRGSLTLKVSDAKTQAFPAWMLLPEAAQVQIGTTTTIPCDTLLEVIELLRISCFALDPVHNDLEPRIGTEHL